MPPPDTTYLPLQPGSLHFNDSIVSGMDSATMMQYLQHFADSLSQQNTLEQAAKAPTFMFSEGLMFLIVVGMLALLYFLFVHLPTKAEKSYEEEQDAEAGMELALKKTKYDDWFNKYSPYYCSLTSELKDVFLHRTIRFMHEKEFRFHQLPEEEQVAALISGAAVQMTLGLKNYLLEYFPIIHVIKKEYVLSLDKETYYGHVSRNGIYISWNHFLEGYADYTDAVNVGLHEMAHAVSYDVFLGQTDRHDMAFRSRLEDFADEGRVVFRAMRQGSSHLLDEYGATNFDEFWAVCVETFFENAEAFSRTMPDLYLSIVDLLNQDPLKPGKIINRQLAGLEG